MSILCLPGNECFTWSLNWNLINLKQEENECAIWTSRDLKVENLKMCRTGIQFSTVNGKVQSGFWHTKHEIYEKK